MYVNQFIVPEQLEDMAAYSDLVFNSEQVSRAEFLAIKKDDTVFPISLNAIPIKKNNVCIGARGILIDFTEQKRFEEELMKNAQTLHEHNANKDKFFSIIAHDLKSPFSGFLGMTKMMSENILDLSLSEMKSFSQQLRESAKDLYALLENLLEWSRIQRNVIEFNPEICYINYLVKQNIDIANGFAIQKNIEITNKITSDIRVIADIPMINTVLRNLISNAIKFTPIGGQIEIGIVEFPTIASGLKDSGQIYVYVKDSGIGMDETIISKLFKIDSKVSRPGTEGESSTGLGLILCKEFVEKNNGRIWVESKVGEGSIFFFTLKQNI